MKRLVLFRLMMTAILLFSVLTLAGCSGDDGATGATGATGAAGGAVLVADKHGEAALLQTGEFAGGNKSMAAVAITSATADASGVATVNFTVMDSANAPVATVASVSAGIFKLAPKGSGLSYNKWVSYIWREETVSGATFPQPDGPKVNQAYRESSGTGASNGTLVNNGGGG